jgi:hypothetical protein
VVLVDLIDKVTPVLLIELIIGYFECLLEVVESDLAAAVGVEVFESPV